MTQKTHSNPIEFDWKLYKNYVENPDLTDEEKEQAIKAMWNIVINFVDYGFGVHPVQQANPKMDIDDQDIQDLVAPHFDNPTK